MATAILGKIAYHAGASGTVSLVAGEKLLHVRALGAAGAKLTINGGNEIPIPASYTFDDSIDSLAEEFVGPMDLVFTSTLSYFVKTKKPVGS